MSQPVSPSFVPHSGVRAAFEAARARYEREPLDSGARNSAPTGAKRQIAQAASSSGGPVTVERAIASAAQQTGIDFDFLIAQAQVESAMDPTARARTSSATGLYQFIESTWLETMHRHGDRFGLGNVSAAIRKEPGGAAYVADPGTRQAILDLRNDPQIASLMAAGLAEDNRAHLAPILGRQPDHSELYLAHFLGAGGAGRFLEAMGRNPDQSAASLFRRPAAANRPVFYEPNGAPRSLQGVMDYLSGKLERARANAPVSMSDSYQIAALAPPAISAAAPDRPPYLIADEEVFAPQSPPVITGQDRPRLSSGPALALAQPGERQPVSTMLRSTFEEAGGERASKATRDQIERAYDRLKALGF
ncbi:transglycosylase SLT domain-containing protein [Erythrobacter sp. SCSIO 43205]|uniref:transglycosylase SLT domain-containing protein n=1 Tax=Erythrobacter sp. SCSIO 43205 TaxID=2779361 RepID=UPI001CA8DABE|nr:transglycosylase SLT domain-containing protein [Erythrobacter sp. SCSIO 43205]UAB78715.1 transglycosylase SLT domain-containing protein [Erythrobacter sp. SCSIO 43205]